MSETIKKMTLEEQIAYCSGENFWNTKAMPQHGIPSEMMCDGPHGLRKQEDGVDMLGINRSVPATCFPTAVSTACSWDEELLTQVGEAIAREAAAHGVGTILGPGANIKRNPLCGRSFEYFSEDPQLAGKLAAAYIRGAEATGVNTSLKHFAFNNQEYKRFSSDSVVDERTMREIYLPGFEMAVEEGKPSTVMCAYNKLNGIHCSDNKYLLTDILRGDWGYDGMVVTDWGAMNDRAAGFRAGCDLCMPGGSAYMEKECAAAVQAGTLDKNDVARSAERVLHMVQKGLKAVADAKPVDMQAHYDLARKAAAESAVLLKNEDSLLPLNGTDGVVFFGDMAKNLRYQGAGSSHINPWKLTQVSDACPDVTIADNAEAARNAKVAVVFAGLTDEYESEGFDRENMRMPESHVRLIEDVAALNPNTVVVLMCGSVVETSWADKVKAILYMGLPGEAGGDAIADLLFGRAVPCGKLAETWPMRYEDVISATYYAHGKKDAHYREGLYVGYRYYATAGVKVRWPFGYGLSYTSFAYSDLQVKGSEVSCTVTNTGKVPGKEIAQLYIAPAKCGCYRPVRELKGFAKVALAPGESKRVTFSLNDRSFAIWQGGWVVPSGTYTVQVGPSSEDLPLSATIEKAGVAIPEDRLPAWYHAPKGVPSHTDFEKLVGHTVTEKPLKKGEFTMENTVMEMKDFSLMMKIMYIAVRATIAKGFPKGTSDSDPSFKMMMSSAADCSLSGMKINGAMNNHVLEGMLEMANGHWLRGILTMMR